MSEICQLLSWDSAFFGWRIGRLGAPRLDPDCLEGALAWAERSRVDCLYMLADADHPATIELLEAAGFGLKDLRATYSWRAAGPARAVEPPPGVLIRPARPADLPDLEAIAAASHTDTRFFADQRLAPRAPALYTTWIRQSCAGQADAVLVPEQAGRPQGYITCLRTAEGGQIGLVAIAAAAHGAGLGAALVSAAQGWFAQNGIGQVRVVTQGRNMAAQRLYQRAGFVSEMTQLWYHRWFSR